MQRRNSSSRFAVATCGGSLSGRKHSCRVLTINGRRCTTEANILILDETENVGAPTSLHRQRQSPDRFTRYMDLMRKCIVTEPSSF